MKILVLFCCLICPLLSFCQSPEYLEKKQKALAEPSPFEKIANEEEPRELEYEDDEIMVFKGLRSQAPVHFLIVPKRRIPTANDLQEQDDLMIGKMVLVAQKIAQRHGIAESGYRLVFNTNEDAGQSVFHLHLHLLGGMKLGAMVDQTWRNEQEGKK